MTETAQATDPLAKLREPFPAHQISKLPKPTAAQTKEVKDDYKKGIRCEVCGSWHHPKVVHLDYVGHAALTDRLLDADPHWSWEPVAFAPDGMPAFDKNGGLWIRLTVCGVMRLGYGNAEGKTGGDAVKEIIGDALRNAAMRFGAALDLWHKGDLHGEEEAPASKPEDHAAYGGAIAGIDKAAERGLETLEKWPEVHAKVLANLEKSDPTVHAAIKLYYASQRTRLIVEDTHKNHGTGATGDAGEFDAETEAPF